MQKIRKILDVAPEKKDGQTNKKKKKKKNRKKKTKQKESILYRLHSMGPTNESA